MNKKYDWFNLFFACQHCNSVKQYTFPTGSSNLLNCTDRNQKVDYWIEYRVKLDEKLRKRAIITKNSRAINAVYNTQIGNTVKLLDIVFNGWKTALKNAKAENLLQKVNRELDRFRQKLFSYKEEENAVNRDNIKKELVAMLSYEAPFAAFKRWIVRDMGMVAELPFINATDGAITLISTP